MKIILPIRPDEVKKNRVIPTYVIDSVNNLIKLKWDGREAGWDVVYDKPGYCEDYKAFFIFKEKKSSANFDYWRGK